MSHSTTLVVIRDASNVAEAMHKLNDLMEPFDENAEVTPYEVEMSDEEVGRAVAFYREHPEECKGGGSPEKPFDQYVTEGNLEAWHEWTRQAVGGYTSSDASRGTFSDDKYGYMSTYNPDSRWDWWTLGGRWHGFFQLKPKISVGAEPQPEWRKIPVGDDRVNGLEQVETYTTQNALLGGAGVFGDPSAENFEGRADLARKGDIDFDAMRALAAQQADLAYDKFEAATQSLPLPEEWLDCMKRFLSERGIEGRTPGEVPEEQRTAYKEAMDAARTFYHQQPWIKALREADLDDFFGDPIEKWCVHTGGRTAFVERARASAVTTFAVLLDGTWHERGRMGWWGVVHDEDDKDEWARRQWELIKDLPDDTYLAVVDVHI